MHAQLLIPTFAKKTNTMKGLIVTLLLSLIIIFGVKGQYDYHYSTTTTKKDYNGGNRNITIILDFSVDSLYRSFTNYPKGHYGFYFSYNIKFYYENTELNISDGYNFDNLRL